MANFTPSPSWTWLTTNDRLALRYGAAPSELQLTPVNALPRSVEAGSAFAFTLEHAEMFWTFWHALEPLQYAEAGRFAAAIDATACNCFLPQQGQKSWHFQQISTHYFPTTGEIVLLAGQSSGLALVAAAGEQSSVVLILENLVSLAGKQLQSGHPILVLNNRMMLWQPQPSIRPQLLPKTA
jgi:hypothetical protein